MRARRWFGLVLGTAAVVSVLRARRSRGDERFYGCVVVITGGSRGLGLALAREFARRGARIALLSRDELHLQKALDSLENEFGSQVTARVCDVRDQAGVNRSLAEIVRIYGRIDVLVNNAGVTSVGPIETMTRTDYEDSIATHFWGTYNTVQAAWKTLCESRGRIVNITSIGGRISVPHLLPYSVSKFATVGYSEGLRAEGARFGVSVTTVAPGLMRTGSPRNAWFKGRNEAEYTWFMVSETLPFLSVSASAAARRIVDGCARREANIDIGLPAKLATRLHGVAPGMVTRGMEIAARLLPRAGENQKLPIRGAMSETGITHSPLTALGRKAEIELNQL